MSLAVDLRPKKFSEVIGQKLIVARVQSLLKTIKSDVFLFYGNKGVGKTTIARLIAKYFNCWNKQDLEPCNKCPSCKSINEGHTHLNILEIDAASNRGINEVRELRELLLLKPFGNGYRVVILDESHQLTKEAFNALLKCFEDLPERNIIILCTTNPISIPDTIKSRCKIFQFGNIKDNDMYLKLKDVCKQFEINFTEDELKKLVKYSEGSMRNALQNLESVSVVSKNNIVDGTVDLVLSKPADLLLSEAILVGFSGTDEQKLLFVEKIIRKGEDCKNFISNLLFFLRDLLIVSKMNKPEIIIQNKKVIEQCNKLINEINIDCIQLEKAINKLCKKQELLQYNDPRLVLELFLLELKQ